MKQTHQTGFSIIEAIVVISIVSAAFAAILGAAAFFLRGGLETANAARASFLVEEGIEALRYLRDQGYAANITPLIGVGTRYLDPTSSGWQATTTNTPIFSMFTRTITLDAVYRRNADDDIVPATSGDPRTIDPDAVFATVTVSWVGGSLVGQTYIVNIYDN